MSHASPQVEHFDADDPDAFPRPFGSYLLLQRFARGGMGEVFLGKFGAIAGLERYCVLKKLRAELTRDREYVTRFIDEARVVVTLNHANICHVFDVGRVGDEYYLAMEYVSGRDIRTIQDRCRQRERGIPPATALHIVCEVLEALDYAHRRNHPISGEPLNLVHRDVSPQNVLVSYEGEVKLIDFGLAASKLKVERTQPNVVMGKMAYMAPEQARGDPIDARADLFACGVLAYELLSGERFYEGMSANDIWQVAGRGSFVPAKWPALDSEVAKILAKGLHPDPKKRFATCGDFREALASHLHWRFPGTGVRGVRDVINDLFSEEIAKEREVMSRFGRVTIASFRTTFENTQSQSVSLAHATEDQGSVANRTNLTRDEQSSSAPGGTMPPPGSRDVHHEPTRLTTDPKKLLPPDDTAANLRADPATDEQRKARRGSSSTAESATAVEAAAVTRSSAPSRTSEAPVALANARPAKAPIEVTQRVSRSPTTKRPEAHPLVKNLDLEAVTAATPPPRRRLGAVLAGLGVLAAGVLLLVAVRWPSAAQEPDQSASAPKPPALLESSVAPDVGPPPLEEQPAAAEQAVAIAQLPPASSAASLAAPEAAAPEAAPATAAVPSDLPPRPSAEPTARDRRLREAKRSADKTARAEQAEREERALAAAHEAAEAEDQRRRDEEDRRRRDADRKKSEAATAKTTVQRALECKGRCNNEYATWQSNQGSGAHAFALETCVKKKCP